MCGVRGSDTTLHPADSMWQSDAHDHESLGELQPKVTAWLRAHCVFIRSPQAFSVHKRTDNLRDSSWEFKQLLRDVLQDNTMNTQACVCALKADLSQ